MFVYFLCIVSISAILLVQSEETTAPVNSRNENIFLVSAELRLKIEEIKTRRLGVNHESKYIDIEKKCYCRGCASMSLECKGEGLTFSICCVPAKDSKGKDTYVTNVCCQKLDHNDSVININNAFAYFYPKEQIPVIPVMWTS